MRLKRICVVAVAGLVFCSGCFRTTIRSSEPRTEQESGGTLGVSLLWGLTGTTVGAPCNHGIAKAETFMPWWAFLVAGVTGAS